MGFQQIHYDDHSGKLMLLDNYFNYIINLKFNKKDEKSSKRAQTLSNRDSKDIYNQNTEKNNEEQISYEKTDSNVLPIIKSINYNQASPRSKINNSIVNVNEKNYKKEKVKNKLIKILSTYFKSNKLKEISINKSKSNNVISYISSPIKNDYTKFDRNILIDKISKFLEDQKIKTKIKSEANKIDPFTYAIKKILKFLSLYEDTHITYSRKVDLGSPSKNSEFSEKLKKIKSQEKKNEGNFLNDLNAIKYSYKNVNTFNYFESISKTREKFNFSSANENLEDLSFLSNETRMDEEDDNMLKRYQKLKIKSLKEIQKIKEKEDKRIKGFIYPLVKEYPKVQIDISKKELKNNGEFYMKSMELLKKGI